MPKNDSKPVYLRQSLNYLSPTLSIRSHSDSDVTLKKVQLLIFKTTENEPLLSADSVVSTGSPG